MPRLILRRRTEIISEYLISKVTVTVGSSEDNDIVINDQPISLRHCEISEMEGRYIVRDSKSAFGTFVNKKRVLQADVAFGDVISFADSPFDVLFYPTAEELHKIDDIAPRYFLLAIHGKLFGKKYEIKGSEIKVGRDDEFNDIVIPGNIDGSVSRRHATIYFENDKIKITDKRSRNRTFVNQKVVGESDAVEVSLGDEILIGHNIFRLVKEGEEDYSAPKKAGIFIDRYKVPVLRAVAAFSILLSIITICYSAYRILIIKNKPSPLTVSFNQWSPKIDASGLVDFENQVYDITPGLAVGSRISKKNKLIAVAARNGNIFYINPKNGASAWPKNYNIPEGITGSPVVNDLNADGIDDVIVCGNDSRVYIIDGQKGELIFKSQLLGGKLTSSPACADFNEDNIVDIMCVSEDGIVLFVYNPAGSAKEFTVNLNLPVKVSPVVFKDTVTKRYKAAVAVEDGKVYIIDCADRNYSMIDTAECINKRKGTTLTVNEICSTPVVADINGDGDIELIASSKQYYVACFNLRNSDLIWEYYIPEQAVKEFPYKYSSPVAGDMDGDDIQDIIAAWPNGRVYCLSGAKGNLLWKQTTEEWNRFIATPALADLTKDGITDAVLTGENGTLYVLDGNPAIGLEIDRALSKEKISPNAISSTPVIADINSDGYLEIMYKDDLGKIGIGNTNTRVVPGDSFWNMFHKDPMNSGSLVINTYMLVFVSLMILSFAVIAGIAVAVVLIGKKKGVKKPPVISLKEEVTS